MVLEIAGEIFEVVGPESIEDKRTLGVLASGFDRVPIDGETEQFGEKEAFLEPILQRGDDGLRGVQVKRGAARAEPKGLDEHGQLADMIAVHVADPDRFREVRAIFFLLEITGDIGAAVEEERAFRRLDNNAGMFTKRTRMPIRRPQEGNPHLGGFMPFSPTRGNRKNGIGIAPGVWTCLLPPMRLHKNKEEIYD